MKEQHKKVFSLFPFFLFFFENLTFMLLFDGKQSCTVKVHSTLGRERRARWGEENREEDGASEQAE